MSIEIKWKKNHALYLSSSTHSRMCRYTHTYTHFIFLAAAEQQHMKKVNRQHNDSYWRNGKQASLYVHFMCGAWSTECVTVCDVDHVYRRRRRAYAHICDELKLVCLLMIVFFCFNKFIQVQKKNIFIITLINMENERKIFSFIQLYRI